MADVAATRVKQIMLSSCFCRFRLRSEKLSIKLDENEFTNVKMNRNYARKMAKEIEVLKHIGLNFFGLGWTLPAAQSSSTNLSGL